MKKKINDKIIEKRQKRIIPQKRLPKVNQELADKLSRGKNGPLVDQRFSGLFEREEFQQDTNSFEFKLRNPTVGSKSFNRNESDEDDLDVEDDYQPTVKKSIRESSYIPAEKKKKKDF
jgi:hypothetical protein